MVQNVYCHEVGRPRAGHTHLEPKRSMPRVKEFDPEAALERALDLFWRRGYEATSLRELVEHMEIPRQSLYDTFGDKRSLFLKVLARYEEQALHNTVKLLEIDEIPSYRLAMDQEARARAVKFMRSPVALRGFFETYLHEVVLDSNRGSCLMANTALEVGEEDPEILAVVRAYFQRVEEAFFAALTAGVEAGELKPSRDLRALARHLVNALYGLGIMGRSGASRLALRQMVDVALSVIDA